jgi:hypothetical protein
MDVLVQWESPNTVKSCVILFILIINRSVILFSPSRRMSEVDWVTIHMNTSIMDRIVLWVSFIVPATASGSLLTDNAHSSLSRNEWNCSFTYLGVKQKWFNATQDGTVLFLENCWFFCLYFLVSLEEVFWKMFVFIISKLSVCLVCLLCEIFTKKRVRDYFP